MQGLTGQMEFTVAIDGPAAAGKGTIARALARHFGFHFLDTGALYRMVGLAAIRAGGEPITTQSAIAAALSLDPASFADSDLRTEKVGAAASIVAVIPEVRAALLEFQRSFARRPPGAVLDGRDIGTVICPDAEVKLFVTARFKDHPGINSAYLRFLTCTVASQSTLGLRESFDALGKKMTKLEKSVAEAATKESLVKVDNKVENYIRSLKKPAT